MQQYKQIKSIHSDDSNFEQEVKDLLLFHKIVNATRIGERDAILILDNGVELFIEGNEGCGGCGNGWFYIDELNACDNTITNVECKIEGSGYDDSVYQIFVYAENQKIKCLEVSGYDNGYYGTGYSLTARIKDNGQTK